MRLIPVAGVMLVVCSDAKRNGQMELKAHEHIQLGAHLVRRHLMVFIAFGDILLFILCSRYRVWVSCPVTCCVSFTLIPT